MGLGAARAARTRSRAPRWMPARAPIRGGRRCSPAWGDCAEPMASLAASARLHRRPAPHRPGGAPEPSSRCPRLSRRLTRPPPWSRLGNSNGRERREGSGEERGGLAAPPPSSREGRLDVGLLAGRRWGARRGSPRAGRDAGPRRDWKWSPRAGAGLEARNESLTPFLLPVEK